MLKKLLNIPYHEKTEAINNIIEQSSQKRVNFLLNTLAVTMAVMGIKQNSIPILIGSMLISPLIFPSIGVALGIVLKNTKLLLNSALSLLLNTGVVLGVGSVISFIFTRFFSFSENAYLDRDMSLLITTLVGIVSGIAASVLLSKKELNSMMAGVAIAVALIPPLATSTIMLSLLDRTGFFIYLAQYCMTIVGVVAGSAGVFYLMNFRMNEKKVDQKVEEEDRKNE